MDHQLRILQACNWNCLAIKYQSVFGLMVMRAQKPPILMAGTIPLNLDSFVKVGFKN